MSQNRLRYARGPAVWATLVSAACVFCASCARPALDPVRLGLPAEASPRVAETSAGPAAFADFGDGTPVLVVHGAGGGWDQGALIGDLFAPGSRIIAPSRFGFPGSALPEKLEGYSLQAASYSELLDTLGIEKVVVLAASLGGPSALRFAVDHPERCAGLVLAFAVNNPVLREPGEIGPFFRAMLRSDFLYGSMKLLFRKRLLGMFGLTRSIQRGMPAEERRAVDRMLDANVSPVRERGPGMESDLVNVVPLPEEELGRIACPVLVIHARDDLLVPFENGEYSARIIPGARFVAFEEGGHLLLTHHEEVREAVARFVEEAFAVPGPASRPKTVPAGIGGGLGAEPGP